MPPEPPAETGTRSRPHPIPPPPADFDVPPDRLDLGGEEAFAAYEEAFERLILDRRPIITPRGHEVVFRGNDARHICFCQHASNRPRWQRPNQREIRDQWRQHVAEYISWIHRALTYPNEIRPNTQVDGNETHLLWFPGNELVRPRVRYSAALRPIEGGRRLFCTAYLIDQAQWTAARRTKGGVLWERPRPKRY